MSLHEDAIDTLRKTSRTFFLSIVGLPPGLQEAVASAYLCLRAIDEIEDHPRLDRPTKAQLLRDICLRCQMSDDWDSSRLVVTQGGQDDLLPEVTKRLGDWMKLAPEAIAPRIRDANSAMAERMAYWVSNGWQIRTKDDLDCYTFCVAGAVGLLLCDLWAWYDGTPSHRGNAVGFGRGLQAVNILRNRAEDLTRGVNFFPEGWIEKEVRSYALYNLTLGDAYVEGLPTGPAREFCRLPLALAYATLEALDCGKTKLDRQDVLRILEQGGRGYEKDRRHLR
jgi:farnesyl-diphosphate farnesyltransferase